jgi:hypothetical protein
MTCSHLNKVVWKECMLMTLLVSSVIQATVALMSAWVMALLLVGVTQMILFLVGVARLPRWLDMRVWMMALTGM